MLKVYVIEYYSIPFQRAFVSHTPLLVQYPRAGQVAGMQCELGEFICGEFEAGENRQLMLNAAATLQRMRIVLEEWDQRLCFAIDAAKIDKKSVSGRFISDAKYR